MRCRKYDYSLEDGHNNLIDQKHEALDDTYYHILITKIFDNDMNECLIKLYKLMNYILKYGMKD